MNITSSQALRTTFDNVKITRPSGQKVLNVTWRKFVVKRTTSDGTVWENAGRVEAIDSGITNLVTGQRGSRCDSVLRSVHRPDRCRTSVRGGSHSCSRQTASAPPND